MRAKRPPAASRRAQAGNARPRRGRQRLAGALLAAALLLVALPPFTWPIRGRVSSPYFLRLKPDAGILPALELHRGVDIAAPSGTAVLATAPGLVLEAGQAPELGNYVRIRHLLGIESVYGHLSRIEARPGALLLVPAFQPIGAVGSTGRSTGPHLHFAILARGRTLPPGPFLALHSLRRAILGL